jgi:hypothetical protein
MTHVSAHGSNVTQWTTLSDGEWGEISSVCVSLVLWKRNPLFSTSLDEARKRLWRRSIPNPIYVATRALASFDACCSNLLFSQGQSTQCWD